MNVGVVNAGSKINMLLHTADEGVSLDDPRVSTKALALSLVKITGGPRPVHR